MASELATPSSPPPEALEDVQTEYSELSPPRAGERAQDRPLDMPARGGDLLSLMGLCSFCTSQNTQHMDVKENVYCITKRTSQALI